MKYSQNEEEGFILNYFKDQGRFLDIGAYDGKTFSNTHALALKGWKGICIEPSPSVFPALQELYKDNENIECKNICIGEAGEVDFWDSKGDAVSSTDYEHFLKWESYGSGFTQIKVQSIPVSQLIAESKIKSFDFLNIDVESDSLGFKILKEIDLTDIKMVCIESGSNRAEVMGYLDSQGFKSVYENAENLLVQR